jgi:hypothetical protein
MKITLLLILLTPLSVLAEEAPHRIEPLRQAPYEATHVMAKYMEVWEKPTNLDIAMLVATEALITTDIVQTLRFRSHNIQETNPILGTYPGPLKVITLGWVLPTILMTGTWYVLPSAGRKAFLAGVWWYDLPDVVWNFKRGLKPGKELADPPGTRNEGNLW